MNTPRYHHFPLGDGQSHLLHNTIGAYPELFLSHLSPQLASRGDGGRFGFVAHDRKASPASVDGLDGSVPGGVDGGISLLSDYEYNIILYVYFLAPREIFLAPVDLCHGTAALLKFDQIHVNKTLH